ncbi:MAG: sigma-70 family RNA polymerase sigma factor [Gemmataceae bacterium]|nr:sigma-70 family RNA polymerase sigma factor [Gemmataceae bacterium]
MRQTLAGNQAAFGELVDRYQGRLFATVYRLIGHTEDSRDVVQEAFINAYEALDRFQGDAQFFTWLYRIAVNAAISLRRKRRPAGFSGQGGDLADRADESDGHRPGDALERAERVGLVQEALLALAPEFRTVLVLRELEGLKYERIAEILDVPIGTVRSRIHRARLDLRDIIAGMPAAGPEWNHD